MEKITLLFDVGIAILSVLVLIKLKGYGGAIGTSLRLVGYGIIIVGLSQFLETLGLFLFPVADMAVLEIIHFIHHLVLLCGMWIVFSGFEKLMKDS